MLLMQSGFNVIFKEVFQESRNNLFSLTAFVILLISLIGYYALMKINLQLPH
jgi:hypothetical protein